jgi:UDP-N-acetylmuramoyl-tripeptide--D-alanyl-D-alanine ligase
LHRERDDEPVAQVVVPDTRVALADFTRSRLIAGGLTVVGITGSVGKTTTKDMAAAVLSRGFAVLKTEGNLNTYTGIPITVSLLQPEHEVLVAEYAMSARGEIAELTRMAPPDVAVVLNVGLSHVGLLGSIDKVDAAKRELVDAIGEDGIVILNADDPRVKAMATGSRGRVVSYSIETETEVCAHDLRLLGLRGSEFTLTAGGSHARVRVPIPGRQAVSNAVAAAAVGYAMGVEIEAAAAALETARAEEGRMLLRPGLRHATVIDDTYNASPASMEAALGVLLSESGRPRVAVLGDMLELGDLAPEAHALVGRQAAGVDLLIAIGDFAGDILAGAREGGMPVDRMREVAGPEEAVAALGDHLEGAVVLVKASRGLALERVVEQLLEKG